MAYIFASGVTIKKVGNFKKVKTLTSGDNSALIEAIKASAVLELDDDSTKVKKATKPKPLVVDSAVDPSAPSEGQSKALVLALKNKKLNTSIYAVRFIKNRQNSHGKCTDSLHRKASLIQMPKDMKETSRLNLSKRRSVAFSKIMVP